MGVWHSCQVHLVLMRCTILYNTESAHAVRRACMPTLRVAWMHLVGCEALCRCYW
jgi:hypothetical protein